MSARIDDHTTLRVVAIIRYRVRVWAKPDATWSWQLQATGTGTTRLVTRFQARYSCAAALVYRD